MLGMMDEPVVAMVFISVRREERRRDQEARMAGVWGRRRDVLMDAKRAGSGVGSAPESDAKTEEMSPSFRGPRSLGVEDAACVAVARVRESLRDVTPRFERNVESIVDV